MSLFDPIIEAPRDPILGLTELYNADPNPEKINLGTGVYVTNEGKIPLLRAVHLAEKMLLDSPKPHAYLPIQGDGTFCRAVQQLLFSEEQEAIITVQTLGGTGGLSIGADFIHRFFENTTVAISNPSWENHRALFEYAGLPVVDYTYYDAITHNVNVNAMLDDLNHLPERSVVVLHACCHNPTGMDLSMAEWERVMRVCQQKQLIPFLDMAYQGFAIDVQTDARVVRLFATSGLPVFIANSFSKSFSLYGERIGALSIVTSNKIEAARVLSQIKRIIRTNYSNPPRHGAEIISLIMNTPELRALWEEELGEMRHRIQSMRHQLVEKLNALGSGIDFSFINAQQGMFSYSGLSPLQAQQLKEKHSIYILPTGRICIAALNSHNIDTVTHAIGTVLM